MSRNQIKMIAALTMLVDHLGLVLFPSNTIAYFVMRELIGRISFPLFLALFVDGCHRTHDLMRHATEFTVFGLLSEPFFGQALYGSWAGYSFQNIMWSWAIGVFLFLIMGFVEQTAVSCGFSNAVMWMACGFFVFDFALGASLIGVDYGAAGIVCMAAGYVYMRLRPNAPLWHVCAIAAVILVVMLHSPGALLAIPFMALYRPSKDEKHTFTKAKKYSFYAFYPVHLAALCVVRAIF